MTIGCITGILACFCVAGGVTPTPASDWPTFRHDGQLTGASPLVGGLEEAPAEAWSIRLGAPETPRETARIADVDGDGLDEILRVRSDRIVCVSQSGEVMWETAELPRPTLGEIRDFAGDGTRGLLLWSNTGLERVRYIISGATGQAVRLYAMQNVFGAEERFGKLLPDVAGLQLSAWWSGVDPEGSPEEQIAEGFLFSFENGVENPSVRFEQHLTGLVFAPRHCFADYDQDGETELVMVSHQQAWFFDVSTNQRELFMHWPMIRTYSASMAAMPVQAGVKPMLLSINPHIPGVECVAIREGETEAIWKQVVGEREDQYQNQVAIAPGAPDPFLYLQGDGRLFVLASVTNERADGRTCLVVLDGITGERLLERPDVTVVSTDDLDGDGRLELLIKEGDALCITNWRDGDLVERWRGKGVAPVLVPLPDERDLGRNMGGKTPVWRQAPGNGRFLMRFPDGVFACELTPEGVTKGDLVTTHEALGNFDLPPAEQVVVNDGVVVVIKDGSELMRHPLATAPTYLAPPVVVGDMAGERRVLVREHSGALASYSPEGNDRKTLAASTADAYWSICDMDGNGTNEVVAQIVGEDGESYCAFLDSDGNMIRRIGLIDDAKSLKIGPSGGLGPDLGRWLVIYYEMELGKRNSVAAYDGTTGEKLWLRDHYEKPGYYSDAAKFVLHVPTSVYDFDGDGADDLLAASENFFGIVGVRPYRELTTPSVFSDCVPGHWQAYAHPIVAQFRAKGPPQVFHHKAFSQTILTDLSGNPLWHFGLTRDTTASSWPGIGDLDGDGTVEVVQTRVDGLITAFDSRRLDQTCPRCPRDQALDATNHSGYVRWEMAFRPPVSDMAAVDLDADGCVELLFGSGDGSLYAIEERDGEPAVKWRHTFGWQGGADSTPQVGSPVVVDLNKDGVAEILVPVQDGRIVCLSRMWT